MRKSAVRGAITHLGKRKVPFTDLQIQMNQLELPRHIRQENEQALANPQQVARPRRERVNYFNVPTRSGEVLRLAPFDFTEWSKKDMDDLQAQLKAQSPRKGGAAWFTDDVLGS